MRLAVRTGNPARYQTREGRSDPRGQGPAGDGCMAAMTQSASTAEPAPPRAFVHIGAPKTGTTYVQSVLWRNRAQLADDGVLYPYEDSRQHFPAMLDLRERGWGPNPPGYWRGTWNAVAQRVATWSGHTAILGNEILGGASEAQIRRLVDTLAPAEVHVVFTARDLARQLVSDWQEHIKHKHTVTLEAFVDDLVENGLDAQPPFGEMFWGLHDAEHVLGRWARVVPRGRIHLITLPQPGGPRDVLWRRFCSVTGLDADRYSLKVQRTNTSLGRPEAEVLRRVNLRVQNVTPRQYDALVRIRLTGGTLTGRGGRLVLPEQHLPWVRERSRTLVDALDGAGYQVNGDLEELMPRPADHEGYVPTDQIRAKQMLSVSIRTTAALLRIAAKQRAKIQHYQQGHEGPPPETSPAVPLRVRTRHLSAVVRSRLRRR